MTNQKFWKAVATLTGCVIGAGILGIPFVVVQSGVWTGMVVLAVLGTAMLLLNLMVGEVALRTKQPHQLVGYARKYLGPFGKFLMFLSMVIGVYGALTAYTIGVGESVQAVIGGQAWLWSLLFYGVMAALMYGGLEWLENSELVMEGLKAVLLGGILLILFAEPSFDSGNFVGFSWYTMFLPYGVILFALLGTAIIPEMCTTLKKQKKLIWGAVLLGSALPLLVYALFAAGVIGVMGGLTAEVATIGIAEVVGQKTSVLFHFFGVLAMATSFVAFGFTLKDSYRLDFGLTRTESWLLTLAIPAVLLVTGVSSFTKTLEVAGAFAGGFGGICIVFMHAKAKKESERRPEYQITVPTIVYWALIAMFVLGMVYELALIL